MNQNILIICSDFIPYSPRLGNVIRTATIASYLKSQGYNIHVLTSKSEKFGYFGYQAEVGLFNFHLVQDNFKYNSYHKVNSKVKQEKNISLLSKLKNKSKFLVKPLAKEFIIPDTRIFLIGKYFNAAQEIIQNYQIKNIIISSPIHSIQLVGYQLKKAFGEEINLVVDYRDSWNGRPQSSKKNLLSKLVSYKLEKLVLNSCDYFTYVSQPILTKAEKIHNLTLQYKSYLIMNGFVEENLLNQSQPAKKPNSDQETLIGYFGSFSEKQGSDRDIGILLKLLKHEENYLLKHKIKFCFYGSSNINTDRINNSSLVQFSPLLPHAEAILEMSKMDFLLIYHLNERSSDEVLTGKLFDYISIRKPILCLGPQNMEANKIINKFCIGENINPNSQIDFSEKIRKLDEIKKNFNRELDISTFSRRKQYEKFLSIME